MTRLTAQSSKVKYCLHSCNLFANCHSGQQSCHMSPLRRPTEYLTLRGKTVSVFNPKVTNCSYGCFIILFRIKYHADIKPCIAAVYCGAVFTEVAFVSFYICINYITTIIQVLLRSFLFTVRVNSRGYSASCGF